MCVCECVCVCACVCVCVCVQGEVGASISSLANWVHCALYMHVHLQIYKCTYKDSLVAESGNACRPLINMECIT